MNYANLIQNITENIKTNGSQAITAQVLQGVLVDMVEELGQSGSLIGGVVDTTFNPTASDSNLIYVAEGAGTYTNFNNAVVNAGEVAFLAYDGTLWQKYSASVVDIVDNLSSTDTAKALSANQGKVLNDSLTTLSGDLVERVAYPKPFFPNNGTYKPNGSLSGTGQTAYKHTDKLPVFGAKTFIITADVHNVANSPAVFFDASQNYVWGYTATQTSGTFVVPVPAGAVYVAFSNYNNTLSDWRCAIDFIPTQSVCYLSASGDDTADGLTESTPIKSFERAVSSLNPNGVLYILEGDYENSTFDLGLFRNIVGIGKVRFIQYDAKITSATAVSGYTKVYAAEINIPWTTIYTKFCWQHDIPDATTAISDSDRLPIHAGKDYRLPSTRIYKVNSIADIEAASKPSFYYDSGNHLFYFSKVSGSDLATNPIIISQAKVVTASNRNDINYNNLSFLYNSIALSNLTGRMDSISAGMCTGSGAFVMQDSRNLHLYNCEAYACYTANGGDGFNTHTTMDANNVSTFEGGVSEITMFNCYGHDNSDDGESCHEHCHIIQYGGVYEYNGSGCTPASNGSAEYYNVISRKNGNYDYVDDPDQCGFSCQGGLSVAGVTKYSSMTCYDCISADNRIGYRIVNQDSTVILMNCVSDTNTQAVAGTGATQYNLLVQ